MPHVVRKFHLVGAHEGKTIVLGGKATTGGTQFQFTDGVLTFEGSDKDADHLGLHLARSYQAFPEGPLLEEARKRIYGGEEAPEPTDPVTRDPLDTSGMSLAEAVSALDKTNDDHWTSRGLPSVDAVEALIGGKTTRDAIEEAAPGFTRTSGGE